MLNRRNLLKLIPFLASPLQLIQGMGRALRPNPEPVSSTRFKDAGIMTIYNPSMIAYLKGGLPVEEHEEPKDIVWTKETATKLPSRETVYKAVMANSKRLERSEL